MWLSTLMIDVGTNPDRPRPGRLWLRNLYRVHQRLCMGFMTHERISTDKEFLQPYNADDLRKDQVHVNRAVETGFLFRIDPCSAGRVMILVQSAVEPDWEWAFQNSPFLAAPPVCKPYNPTFMQDQNLRFRLTANPTRKIDTKTQDDGKRRNGKRVPVSRDQLLNWLSARAKDGGFSLNLDNIIIQAGYIYMNKARIAKGQRLSSVRYEGILTVADPDRLLNAIVTGIGTAKAFGFGLLSVGPLNHHARISDANSRSPRAAEVS